MEPGEEEENKEKMVTVKPGLQAKLSDGLKQHGNKVDKVAAGQDRQKLRGSIRDTFDFFLPKYIILYLNKLTTYKLKFCLMPFQDTNSINL